MLSKILLYVAVFALTLFPIGIGYHIYIWVLLTKTSIRDDLPLPLAPTTATNTFLGIFIDIFFKLVN